MTRTHASLMPQEQARWIYRGEVLCCEPWEPCWREAEFSQVDPASGLVRLVCGSCVVDARPYDAMNEPETARIAPEGRR